MQQREKKRLNNRISRCVGIVSVLVGLFVLVNTKSGTGYELYWIIPTVWGLLCFFDPVLCFIDTSNIGPFVFTYTMLIKYCISPIVSCLGEYSSWLGTPPGTDNLQKAVLLTIYESIVLYVVSHYCNKNYSRKIRKIENSELITAEPMKRTWVHYFLVIVGFLSFVLVPAAFADYRFIFNGNDLSNNIFINIPGAGVFKTFFIVGRYSLVLLLVNRFYKKYLESKSLKYVVMSFSVILLNCVYVQNLSRINILIPLLLGIALCVQFFPRKKDRIAVLTLSASLGVLFLVVLSFFKFFGEGRGDVANMTSLPWWGDTLNMYFTGIKETAIGYKSLSYIDSIFGWNRIPLFINDFFCNISLLSNFSDVSKCSVVLYNYIYYGAHYTGQIPPNTIEGVYYFGNVLAPVLPTVFVYLAYKFSYIAKRKFKIDEKFIYLYAALWSGLILMINYNMIVANIINISLFYAVFIFVNRRARLK